MPKRIPTKCIKCASLSGKAAREKQCWDSAVCPSRRSHAKHRDRRNQERNIKRSEKINDIKINTVDSYFAVLIVYRPYGESTPIHAIGVDIFFNGEICGRIHPVHCVGLKKYQIENYIKDCLQNLKKQYNISKFSSLIRLDNSICSIQDCFLRKFYNVNYI